MTDLADKRPIAIRVVLPFVFRHGLFQPCRAALVLVGFLGATVVDLFMPLYSGHLIDALTSGPYNEAARYAALAAVGGIVVLGLVSMVLRLIGLQAIVPFTLKMMPDVAREAFMRAQRFSTDRHANSFAGSGMRKITRGMWALDLVNTTILMSLLPSLTVLIGSMILLGLHWSALGGVIAIGTVIYVAVTITFSVRYIAPASRVSNAWDTRIGGTLADALTCNSGKIVRRGNARGCSAGPNHQPLARAAAANLAVLQLCRHVSALAPVVPAGVSDRRRGTVVDGGACLAGGCHLCADQLLRYSRVSARGRPIHQQPPALSRRDGGAGRNPSSRLGLPICRMRGQS